MTCMQRVAGLTGYANVQVLHERKWVTNRRYQMAPTLRKDTHISKNTVMEF